MAPDGNTVFVTGGGKFARINLSAARPLVRVPVETVLLGAHGMALTPNGLHAWVTSPDSETVSEVDTDPNSATYGQAFTLAIPGAPDGIAISPNGQRAYVTDQSAGTVYELGVDPNGGGYRQRLREFSIPDAILSGGIAVDPHGHQVYVGSTNQGLLTIDLDAGTVAVTDPTPIGGGIGVTPAGGRLLAATGDISAGRIAYRDLPSGANAGSMSVGGEASDIAMSPGGGTAFVANALYSQLQVIDVTQSTPTQVASVGTGLGPAAIAMSASGQMVAVANQAGHSVSLFNNAPAAVSPLRAMPAVAIAGDQVALQVTGTLTGSSALDFDGGGLTLGHVTVAAGTFTAPSAAQHDGSLTLTTGGARSLSVPFRLVDPIPVTVPKPTGFVIDPNNVSCGSGSVDGAMTTMRVSPDGTMLAVSREPGCVRLDLYRLSTTQGAAHFGDRLIDGLSWAPSGVVQDLAFTPDGHHVWGATDAGGLVEINVDPTSPLFRTASSFGNSGTIVHALAADPYGRYMLVGAEPSPGVHELELWSTGRTLLQSVPVGGRIHSLAPTPDGHYVVAGGEGRAYVIDVDAASLIATTPAHAVNPPDVVRAVAVTTNGHQAMGVFPSGRVAVWNTDAGQGAIGAELYFGAPAPGVDLGPLVPAPNGRDLLAGCSDCNTFVEITPGATPTVSTTTLAQPVRAMARTPDGRQLWVSNWNDGTLLGDVRLFSASTASQIAVVSGSNQAAPAGATLPQPIRVQVTDALGQPQEGVPIRFVIGAGQGSLDLTGTTQTDKLSDLNGEASVTWTTPATPAALSLSVSALGAPGASLTVAASATGSDAATPPTVVDMGPADGATGINFNTSLFVRFSQPMDSTSLEGALTLTQNGSTTARTLSFSNGYRVVLIIPYNPFPYSANGVLQVASGAMAIAGQTLASTSTTHFTIEPQPDLKIASVSPPSGPPGVPITLTGEGFDLIPARNTIRIGSVVVPATSVTATTLVTTVPADAAPGSAPITVQVGSTTSPAAAYEVLSPNPHPLNVSQNAATRGGVQAIDITPDGTRAYITIPSSNSVLAYSLRDRTVIKIIPVGLQPQSISILSNGKYAYVANTGSNDVSVIDTDPQSPTYNRTLQTTGHPVKVGSQPTNVASSAFGPQVLVLNSGDGTISVLDAESDNATFDRVVATANAGSGGKQIVITPDGTRAYVANSEGIIMIDLKSKEVTTVANSGSGGKQVVISPDGALLFALTGSGDLLIIDIAPGSVSFNKVVATANTGSGGKQVVISPDGTLLYVTLHEQNSVAVFRIVSGAGNGGSGGGVVPGPVASLVPVSTIPVGQGPSGMAMSRDGSFAVVVNEGAGTISLLGAPTLHGSTVTVTPPATCLTPAHACLALPVTIHRDSVASLRAFSVKLQLSPNLALCGTQADEGNYLSAIGATIFQVTNTGPGAYTVDGTLLGQPCGATATDGTLFTLHVTSSAPGGTGTVSVTTVTLRDCDNVPIASAIGPDASITIDNIIPAAIAALASTPLRTANGGDGTTRIVVSWPAVDPGADVLVYRAPFGNYPEYDDPPNAGSVPATPTWPPAAPWTAVATVTGGVTSVADEPATRDFWYYTAFVRDACGNVSPVSNLTSGTLDYNLGDVHNGIANCVGDNHVDLSDISFLGAHYGVTLGTSDPLGCLDVGPTTDSSVEGRPTTDNLLNFEDLIMMAIHYGTVSAPQRSAGPAPADSNQVLLESPSTVHQGDVLNAVVHLRSTGAIQGLSVHLGWNSDVLEPLGLTSGGFAEAQGGVVMSSAPGSVDAALLGRRSSGLTGDGVLASLQFRAKASGDPRLVIHSVDARGPANQAVKMGVGGGTRVLPARTELAAARPNPFQGSTELHFALARGGPVELVVYAVDGRRVKTLVHETREPGEYQVSWDGTDDAGHVSATGMYFARLSAPGARVTRSLIRIR
jgi:YVTN family beta-propeller protein